MTAIPDPGREAADDPAEAPLDLSPTPRPPGEEEQLKRIWASPRGLAFVTDVNNSTIGLLYMAAAFLFFLLAGVMALLMRVQLAVPDNDLLSQDLYNQLFTVHGTTMMFLFAVPIVEAQGVLLLPQMLAARDLPFPRLSAYAVWAYIIGGLVFVSTVLYGLAPDGGWFMYPTLTTEEYSPGIRQDFWLLGIGFIEISAIAGAVEIIVGTLRTRPPGMTLARMPIFAWSMLIFAAMIVFAFPAVILATMLLELERAFGWPFFSPERGGDPVLWQHLFWFFGHPEVYIIFLPAAGLVSMMVPTIARHRLVGHRLIVVALVVTGFFSFGLWVHHMFATGLPGLSLAFFSAASMAVAVPSGIQVFSWIATLAAGARNVRLTTPALFILGFLFIFVLGGLTGVMVALAPFDWLAHDSYFVVAHLHYVLIGGLVFPMFAALYYWAPFYGARPLSERMGRWAFWLTFLGFNVAFLPMHWTGLRGMPRRVWTYPEGLGWDTLNLVSTAGALVMAAGVALILIDVILHFRLSGEGPANPWGAGTLEWLPNDVYSTRSIPHVAGRDPLWDQPGLAEAVERGAQYLPDAPTGDRETIVTTVVDARPDYLIQMAGPGWYHFLAAVFTAGFFLLLTVKAVILSAICGVLAVAFMLLWGWQLDRPDKGPVAIGGGIRIPSTMTGPRAHSWWAMVILMLVAASLWVAWAFAYLFLWTVSPEAWEASPPPPGGGWPVASALLFAVAGLAAWGAGRALPEPGGRSALSLGLHALAAAAIVGAVALDVWGLWASGLRPSASAHGAAAYMGPVLSGQAGIAAAFLSLFAAARQVARLSDRVRRVVPDNAMLWGLYSAGQGLAGLLLVHGFPRLVGG